MSISTWCSSRNGPTSSIPLGLTLPDNIQQRAETNSGFDIRCSTRRAGGNQGVVRPTLAPQTGATVRRRLRKSRALAALTKGVAAVTHENQGLREKGPFGSPFRPPETIPRMAAER
ncbi:hypothetical protein T07_11259 [Trichinella nelsoni]|uniref:Uncharacterized protein n=1 Tax=Trichinella nelsoni TaxID=6336 RepID=A0A0V0S3T9_9BILA|nr:hypothetical protein T07_11259 [Trichinella nelsoni]